MAVENESAPECTVETDLDLVRCYQAGDQEAMDALMQRHMWLIEPCVNKLRWANPDEIKQEALIGFYKAVKEFDVSRFPDFHDTARSYIKTAVYDSAVVMPVNRALYRRYRKVLKVQDELLRKLGRRPTLGEIGAEVGLSVKQVDYALDVIARFHFSIETEDGTLAIAEPHHTEDHYQSQLVKDLLKQLSSSDAALMRLFYFLGHTDTEIAEYRNESTDAVKMRRTRLLKKLADIMERGSLKR